MVPERGVELDAGIEQRLVRELELLGVVRGPFATVQVVAHHDRKLERKLGPKGRQLLRHCVLTAAARASVANDGKLYGPVLHRQAHVLSARHNGKSEEQYRKQ